eukprot:CAMPEP_0172900902 /NCGR_PEP_ID=MMETSP1075-20121228/165063_1 /TAXON_ID=2916 /ORGANISM="Ceratium fusus, Strain PA161109" /LENGTH=39 /DNA_ID= /DNA_START= /DNA_END= /DNA_ORIENTATION=
MAPVTRLSEPSTILLVDASAMPSEEDKVLRGLLLLLLLL